MTQGQQVTDRQRKRILRLHKRGYNGKVIARSVDLHPSTIYAILRADQERLAEIEAQPQQKGEFHGEPLADLLSAHRTDGSV